MSNFDNSKATALAKLEEAKEAILTGTMEEIILCFGPTKAGECEIFVTGDVGTVIEMVLHLSDIMHKQAQKLQRSEISEIARELAVAGILGDPIDGFPEGIEAFQFTKH